jgi:hypothetical protein
VNRACGLGAEMYSWPCERKAVNQEVTKVLWSKKYETE